MPISQDRIIDLVHQAQNLVDNIDQLQFVAERLKNVDFTIKVNGAIDHIADPITQDIVRELQTNLTYLLDHITTMVVPLPFRIRLVEERAHFKANAQRNKWAAAYQHRKRHPDEDKPKAKKEVLSEEQQEAIRRKHWPENYTTPGAQPIVTIEHAPTELESESEPPSNQPAVQRQHKPNSDIVSSSLPSDEEINKPFDSTNDLI